MNNYNNPVDKELFYLKQIEDRDRVLEELKHSLEVC
jgi:hypothetical protein